MAKKKIDEDLLREMAAQGFRRRKAIDNTTATKDTTVPFERDEERAEQDAFVPKKKQENTTEVQPPSLSLQDYETRFFKTVSYTDRMSYAMRRETLETLRNIITFTGNKTTLSAFIENIIREHLHAHRDLLNQAFKAHIPKQIIP